MTPFHVVLDQRRHGRKSESRLGDVISRVGLNLLSELFALLRGRLLPHYPHLLKVKPKYRPFRAGDVRHSEADIKKAKRLLGYAPTHRIGQGLDAALDWYRKDVV